MSGSSDLDKLPNTPAKPPKAPGLVEWGHKLAQQACDNLNRAREETEQGDQAKASTLKDPGVQEFGDRCARETLEKLNRAHRQATANPNPAGVQKK
jgi:hypothetical protein